MDNSSWQFIVGVRAVSTRLDRFLSDNLTDKSRSYIAKLIKGGYVLCNNKKTKASYLLREKDLIIVSPPKLQAYDLEPVDIPIEFIFEDDDIAVINKPAPLSVHVGSGITGPTLVNTLLYHCKNLSGIGGIMRPGIVHRLDKETSGIMVVAKNDLAHRDLSDQFSNREIKKSYLALVHGVPKEEKGLIDIEIGRDKNNKTKISQNSNSPKSAITEWELRKALGKFSLIEAKPLTGRTHQIRVHLSLLGHPILGDKVYMKGFNSNIDNRLKKIVKRHFLHAESLSFRHPTNKSEIQLSAKLPRDLDTIMEYLET